MHLQFIVRHCDTLTALGSFPPGVCYCRVLIQGSVSDELGEGTTLARTAFSRVHDSNSSFFFYVEYKTGFLFYNIYTQSPYCEQRWLVSLPVDAGQLDRPASSTSFHAGGAAGDSFMAIFLCCWPTGDVTVINFGSLLRLIVSCHKNRLTVSLLFKNFHRVDDLINDFYQLIDMYNYTQ